MDPNATLAEARDLASRILHIENTVTDPARAAVSIYEHAVRLAELTEALDKWLARGGFLPEAWRDL